MQTTIHSQFYPISLDEIKIKVAKKNGRKKKIFNSNSWGQFSSHDTNLLGNIKKIVNEFGEETLQVDGDIPVDLMVNNGERFLFISYDQSAYTHGIHKYPAKFFPELPRWLIRSYSKEGDMVLDPFSGSGTTNLEALLLRRNSVGIDVDPFSRFLSKVKTTPLEENELKYSTECLLKLIQNYHPSKISESNIPSFPYRDNWFNKEIILELSYLKNAIETLDVGFNTKNFFKICFSSIIRSVSNADDNCTRTVIRKRLNKKVCPGEALKKFAEAILIKVPKVIEFSNSYPRDIKTVFPKAQDARNIQYKEGFFDLALTSPPYVNAVDYPRTHQLEIYWLGLAKDSLAPLKKEHVGTESVSYKDYSTLHKIGVSSADVVIENIFEKDPRRAYIAYKYLNDMNVNLMEVYKVLKKNGRYIIVVGNNKIRGELFENWRYIMEMASNIGFSIEKYFGSEIIRHFIKVPREERINTDWVLVLKK